MNGNSIMEPRQLCRNSGSAQNNIPNFNNFLIWQRSCKYQELNGEWRVPKVCRSNNNVESLETDKKIYDVTRLIRKGKEEQTRGKISAYDVIYFSAYFKIWFLNFLAFGDMAARAVKISPSPSVGFFLKRI